MKLRTAAGVGVALLLLGAPAALAHQDDTPDNKDTRCDKSTARGGHDGEAQPGDLLIKLPNGYEIWAPGGHYVVRGPEAYVEVVGGQSYNRNGNQGGYVQGEVDRTGPGPDVDFHVNVFAGQNEPKADSFACVNYDGQRYTTPSGSQP